jgi:hypothetical protein
MKIIEGMKKLRVIEKRMVQNRDRISKYSSSVSTEKPLMNTEDEQRAEIKSLVQANHDLLKEYLDLKCRIERTNLDTKVEVAGFSGSISELLVARRKLALLMASTYEAMNDSEGSKKLSGYGMRSRGDDGARPDLVRFYDEREKNEGLRKWQDIYESIDSRLEVINATTDLVDKHQ